MKLIALFIHPYGNRGKIIYTILLGIVIINTKNNVECGHISVRQPNCTHINATK